MYALPVDVGTVRALLTVSEAATSFYVALSTELEWGSDPATTPATQTLVAPTASPDGEYTVLDRPKVISGRRPDPTAADEVAVNPSVADRLGLRVQRLHRPQLRSRSTRTVPGQHRGRSEWTQPRLRVVGIEVAPGELTPREQVGSIHLSPAFLTAYADQIAVVPGLTVKLRHGQRDLAAFKESMVGLAGGAPIEIVSASHEGSLTTRGIHIEAQALRLFALLAGVASLLIAHQAMTRQTFSEADDHQALKAVGMTRRQLWAAAMIRTAGTAAVAAVVAVAGAAAASSVLPFGRARLVEPSPGVSFDAFVLLVGVASLVVVLIALAAGPAWRATKAEPAVSPSWSRSPSVGRLGDGLARWGASPAAVTGVRMATSPGRGRTAVPVRAAIVGSACSLAALVLAFSFGASLDRLFTTPHLYGWNWDAIYGDPFGDDIAEQARALTGVKEVAGFSPVSFGEVEVDGIRVPGVAFDPVEGNVVPPVVEGRAPVRPDEIVVGSKVLDATGRHVSDTVTVTVGDGRVPMRIVGRGVLPAIGRSEVGGLGDGALLSASGLRDLAPELPANLVAVRFAAGTDHHAAQVAVGRALGGAGVNATAEQTPVEVADYGRIDRLPRVLAALLALVAAATLAHALASTVLRRRREIAILKTLGFVSGQVRSTVAWQATTIVAAALVIGLPVGLAAGRWVWRLFAEGLGVLPEPVVPWLALGLTVAGAILVANLIAAVPGRSAARARPAAELRSQ